MIDTPLSPDGLTYALRRIEDFYAVQRQGEVVEKAVALGILKESLGVDSAMTVQFKEWIVEFIEDEEYVAPMLLGLMIGLIAHDYETRP